MIPQVSNAVRKMENIKRNHDFRITETQLLYVMPYCRMPTEWVRPLNNAFAKYNINNVKRAACFLGQTAHESGQYNKLEENLNYSPQRLLEVWPKRFPELKDALKYSRNPEKLGNLIYDGRLGNGPHDGFRYRGRGLIQITGKVNYEKIAELLDLPGLVQHPDNLRSHKYAAESAAAWWEDRGLNEVADKLTGENIDTVVKLITQKVNGGDNGLEERLKYTKLALEILDTDFSV